MGSWRSKLDGIWSRGLEGRRLHRLARRTLIIVAGLGLILALGGAVLEEPLRRQMEREVNHRLTGYSVRIPKLDLQLFRLAVDLRDVEIRQVANPEPAVALLPRLHASVQWKALFRLRVVADFVFEKPAFYVNLIQARAEASSPVAFKRRGWQEAALAIFPLRVNLLKVKSGRLTYIDEDPGRPLELKDVQLEAEDIRNVRSHAHAYPSPVRFEATVFGVGHAVAEGHADFLSEPYPGAHVRFALRGIPLESLQPLTRRADLRVRGGSLEARGELELAPGVRVARLGDLRLGGLLVDYVKTRPSRPASGAGSAARPPPSPPSPLDLRIERFRVVDSTIGFENRARSSPYRVWIGAVSVELSGYRRGSPEPSRAELSGRFMDSGPVRASLTLPHGSLEGSDFDLVASIGPTDVTRLNPLLRSHAGFDAAGGRFSLYSEMRVHDGFVRGYVKPLFQDLQIYDPRQDRRKGFFRKTYEGAVGMVAKVFQNRKRDEVATVVPISGRVAQPNSNVIEAVGGLVENAFFQAILPGFEKKRTSRP